MNVLILYNAYSSLIQIVKIRINDGKKQKIFFITKSYTNYFITIYIKAFFCFFLSFLLLKFY